MMLNLTFAPAESTIRFGAAIKGFRDSFQLGTRGGASMLWKIVLVLGILGVLLGFLVTGISVALPIVEGPRVSWEEAMLGIIPGAVVLFFSFFLFLLGLIFVIKNRKRT